jgi:hypothetical protein
VHRAQARKHTQDHNGALFPPLLEERRLLYARGHGCGGMACCGRWSFGAWSSSLSCRAHCCLPRGGGAAPRLPNAACLSNNTSLLYYLNHSSKNLSLRRFTCLRLQAKRHVFAVMHTMSCGTIALYLSALTNNVWFGPSPSLHHNRVVQAIELGICYFTRCGSGVPHRRWI